MSLKVYTKTGDKGKTSLLGGNKVPKSSMRIEAYGNSDELNAFIGWLKDHDEAGETTKDRLQWVQEKLFTIGSHLATEPGFSGFSLPEIKKKDISRLEKWIDEMDEELPELKNFILPGGHKIISLCHVCRTVCRRVERSITALNNDGEVNENIVPFINRLSDYFFVLSRKFTQDIGASEIPWKG